MVGQLGPAWHMCAASDFVLPGCFLPVPVLVLPSECAVKPVCERCSIVVAGTWNQDIFTPTWVERLFALPSEPPLELVFAPGGVAFRIRVGQLVLEVTRQQLLFRPDEILGQHLSDELFSDMESAAVKVLRRLRETPVRAVGVNLGFDISKPPSSFTGLFDLNDEGLISSVGAVVGSTTITRKLWVENGLLNLTARRDGGPCRLDFNYHHDASSADDAVAKLSDRVVGLKHKAVAFASAVYGLEMETT